MKTTNLSEIIRQLESFQKNRKVTSRCADLIEDAMESLKTAVAETETKTGCTWKPGDDIADTLTGRYSITDLVLICTGKHGSMVAKQLESILDGEPIEDQNPNAVMIIGEFLIAQGEHDTAAAIETMADLA